MSAYPIFDTKKYINTLDLRETTFYHACSKRSAPKQLQYFLRRIFWSSSTSLTRSLTIGVTKKTAPIIIATLHPHKQAGFLEIVVKNVSFWNAVKGKEEYRQWRLGWWNTYICSLFQNRRPRKEKKHAHAENISVKSSIYTLFVLLICQSWEKLKPIWVDFWTVCQSVAEANNHWNLFAV